MTIFTIAVEIAGRDITKTHIGNSEINIGNIASLGKESKDQEGGKYLFMLAFATHYLQSTVFVCLVLKFLIQLN